MNWKDLASVIDYARQIWQANPQFRQYVVKHPGRDNYNITMQLERAIAQGALLVWQSV